jgi:hypothetical protein
VAAAVSPATAPARRAARNAPDNRGRSRRLRRAAEDGELPEIEAQEQPLRRAQTTHHGAGVEVALHIAAGRERDATAASTTVSSAARPRNFCARSSAVRISGRPFCGIFDPLPAPERDSMVALKALDRRHRRPAAGGSRRGCRPAARPVAGRSSRFISRRGATLKKLMPRSGSRVSTAATRSDDSARRRSVTDLRHQRRRQTLVDPDRSRRSGDPLRRGVGDVQRRRDAQRRRAADNRRRPP